MIYQPFSFSLNSPLHQYHVPVFVCEVPNILTKGLHNHSASCCRPIRSHASDSKRKTQTSFYEEVRQKWSHKQPLTREKFPWQEMVNYEKPQRHEPNKEDRKINKLSVDDSQDAPIRRTPNVSKFANPLEDTRVEKIGDAYESKHDIPAFKQVGSEDSKRTGATTSVHTINAANHDTNSLREHLLPWNTGQDRDNKERKPGISHTRLAEKMLPEHELKRLRNMSRRMVERIAVSQAGITQSLVDDIHEKWKIDEVVKLKIEEPLSNNMKRMHNLLERRTGGLVVWRSGSLVVLFRGTSYKFKCVKSFTASSQTLHDDDADSESTHIKSSEEAFAQIRTGTEEDGINPHELELLLNELGPRFTDWSGYDPIPVDGDKLPAIVNGYRTPQRALPNGVRRTINEEEMTSFRRSARRVPPHFALGRNTGLQGLATAMAKLWERSAIAKIAIKRGVLNTRNVKMAEELKMLTGGTLLSRNKEFIVFYRGNDFLPSSVISTLEERKKQTFNLQENEEDARSRASSFTTKKLHLQQNSLTGTLSETEAISSQWKNKPTNQDIDSMKKQTSLTNLTLNLARLKGKLALAKQKVESSEQRLTKVEERMSPKHLSSDVELISDEERLILRKIGLNMTSYLVVGTRGVFGGTIENIHLHWKHREVVKIIVKRQDFEKVKVFAEALEAESGGVLISVDRTSKGYAVIVYRGKNYKRPSVLRSENLLSRRDALARSIELQRHEALERHQWDLQQEIELRTAELEKLGRDVGVYHV